MNINQLAQSRLRKGLEQQEAARLLGVSQPYLSLLESGKRKLTRKLAEKAVKVFDLPPSDLPSVADLENLPENTNDELAGMLAALGYPKFSHLRKGKASNPAQLLFSALRKVNLDSRFAESLPWLVYSFPEMDWEKLIKYAKILDLQNRLGFFVSLAQELAEKTSDKHKVRLLSEVEKSLEKSRLYREDFWGNLTEAEKAYLKTNRSEKAKHWRVLSDLTVEHLDYI